MKTSLLLLAVSQIALGQTQPIFGIYKSNLQQQREREGRLIGSVKETSARAFLQELTKEPHHAGSSGDRKAAEFVKKQFEEFGFDSRIVEYQVYLPRPVEIKITMLKPERRELPIKESTPLPADALVPFNAYSPSCDLRAEVVYANYGQAEDYRKLQELGATVRGKIAVVRYGRVFRGLKVREATLAGAVGVILYSDPADDGYVQGDIFPKGRMRPWDAAQRGSIRFSESYPGDPLTPNVAATAEAKRIKPEDDPDMPRIPCTPISYNAAQYLLRSLEGPAVPREWQGGLPFTYHLGAGPTFVRLQIKNDARLRPIWNNIGVIRGSLEPDQMIILGGHRDAWMYGAQDPNSGSAVLLEAARVISQELKRGWRPKRTLVFAQWDAEEYSMIGSTEYGEQFADELHKHAVAYLNFDGSVSGSVFGASGVPSLDDFLVDITRDVTEPRAGVSLFEVWWKNQNHDKPFNPHPMPDNDPISVGRMGGGSDHVVFLNHLGIPSMGFGFGGANGIYHSAYDNFAWMDRFGDPGFVYHAAASRLTILAALRLADADVLPLTFVRYAQEIRKQVDEVEKRFKGILDSSGVNLSDVRAKTDSWHAVAEQLAAQMKTQEIGPGRRDSLNDELNHIERCFVSDHGVKGRTWYRHRVVAASGYASVGLPGISQALEQRDIEDLRSEVRLFVSMLDSAIATTRRAREFFR